MMVHRHQADFTVVTPLQVQEMNHIKTQFCNVALPGKLRQPQGKRESQEGELLCIADKKRTSGF